MTSRPTSLIFIVDDHASVRDALTEFLELEPGLEVCGTAGSGEEALEVLPSSECNIVLVDVSMPGMNGIELVRKLREAYPALRCLMLSGHAEQVYVREAMEAGAWGYVMKGDPSVIVEAVRGVLGGETYLSPSVQSLMLEG